MQKVVRWVYEGDVATFFWINQSWKSTLFDAMMWRVTQLGGALWSISLSLAFLLSNNLFWREKGLHMAFSLLMSHLVVAACKKVLPRRRPYQVLDNVLTGRKLLKDPSFPSGHSTAAFCIATVLSMAIPAVTPVFIILAAMVSFSRVYLGLHYPSDVVVGALLGTLTSLFPGI